MRRYVSSSERRLRAANALLQSERQLAALNAEHAAGVALLHEEKKRRLDAVAKENWAQLEFQAWLLACLVFLVFACLNALAGTNLLRLLLGTPHSFLYLCLSCIKAIPSSMGLLGTLVYFSVSTPLALLYLVAACVDFGLYVACLALIVAMLAVPAASLWVVRLFLGNDVSGRLAWLAVPGTADARAATRAEEAIFDAKESALCTEHVKHKEALELRDRGLHGRLHHLQCSPR
eukprot:TRINITY_DN7196_c0_g1_i2.p1 TRINITY_DN7196_c0_g1~~TRINITY_DN7196_c0_g1_i2.p1  ORF type:complete len:233 (+),score=82.17 TRINITY_DN7196_c0_g1_i2:440-1138(+)